MFTIDETNYMLDEIADSLPYQLYNKLSGGIVLLPQAKIHPQAINNDLYILGEYCTSSIGRNIRIYYGSLAKVYSTCTKSEYYNHLRDVLVHEVRHHVEALAGYRDLIVYDHIQINDYLSQKEEEQKRADRQRLLNSQANQQQNVPAKPTNTSDKAKQTADCMKVKITREDQLRKADLL